MYPWPPLYTPGGEILVGYYVGVPVELQDRVLVELLWNPSRNLTTSFLANSFLVGTWRSISNTGSRVFCTQHNQSIQQLLLSLSATSPNPSL